MTANEILQLKLYNLALNHLGMKSIGNLTGSDPSTVACNLYFEPCRDDILREHEWSFAVVQEAMVAYTGTVPLGFLFAYDYPTTNAATVWTVFNEGCADDKAKTDFKTFYLPSLAKKILCCDIEDAYMEYTYIVTDISMWDAKFFLAVSYRLAASIAKGLTGDPTGAISMALSQTYNNLISEAKRIGAIEDTKKPKQTSGYQAARG